MASGNEALVRDAVTSIVAAAGFDLEGLTIRSAGARRIVRVVIDRDGGVDLDTAAEVSRRASRALDDRGDEVFGGAPYTLEVTSRGVDSPLTESRHFRRAAGRMVAWTLADGETFHGRILRADGDRIVVLTGAGGTDERTIRRDAVVEATVVVEFSRPPAAVTALLAEAGRDTDAGATADIEHEGNDAR